MIWDIVGMLVGWLIVGALFGVVWSSYRRAQERDRLRSERNERAARAIAAHIRDATLDRRIERLSEWATSDYQGGLRLRRKS